MANKKITELEVLTDLDASDLLAIVNDPSGSPVTKRITATNLVKSLNNQSATFVVSASDSLYKERADYVCDGVDDQVEIDAAIKACFQLDKINDWSRYNDGLPVWNAPFVSVMLEGGTYYLYYACAGNLCRALSSDGLNWTADAAHNPVLTPGGGIEWDSDSLFYPCIWKEGGTWYLTYVGIKDNVKKVGLATSADGFTWVKEATNPILETEDTGWEGSSPSLEGNAIIKVGATYYYYYSTYSSPTGRRGIGVATSNDLITWTKDPRNPAFTDDRICPAVFKYGADYYLLVCKLLSGLSSPYYSGAIELYKSSAPTFYPEDTEFLGIALKEKGAEASGWILDTPCVLTDDITRSTFPDNQLWTYFSAQVPNVTELAIETDIDAALNLDKPHGGEIVLLDGTFNIETYNFRLSYGVCLRGQGDGTILNRIGSGDSVLIEDGATLSNLSVNAPDGEGVVLGKDTLCENVLVREVGSNGISLKSVMNATVRRARLGPSSHQIKGEYAESCIIEECIADTQIDKIRLVKCEDMTISKCIFRGKPTTYSLVIFNSNGTLIRDNYILNAGAICLTDNADRNIVEGNIKRGTQSQYAVKIVGAIDEDNIIKDNDFRNSWSVEPICDLGTNTKIYNPYCDLFMDVLAASANHVHAAITGTGAEQEITTAITNPDAPRNVSITNNANSTGDVKIDGVDAKGKTVSDTITIVTGGIAYGVVAFATVSKITIPATVANPDTISVGISDKLGLSNVIYASGDVYKVKVNNADDPTIGTVNTTYNTVDCATINAGDDITIWYKSNLNIIS